MRVDLRAAVSRICFIPILCGMLFTAGCSKEGDGRPAPIFTSMSKRMASAGKEVKIVGSNFAPSITDNTVTFNGTPAVITDATPTRLVMTVPEGATTGPVNVTSFGQSVFAGYFTVYIPGTVTSLSPICGPAGTVITATGNFMPFPDATEIGLSYKVFNYRDIILITSNPGQVTFEVPPGVISGPIRFSYAGELFNVQDKNVYFTIAPFRLTGYSPASGQAGSTVTIRGAFFDTNPANVIVTFLGPGSTVLNATVTTSDVDKITVTIPSGAITGQLTVGMNGTVFVTFPQDFVVVP